MKNLNISFALAVVLTGSAFAQVSVTRTSEYTFPLVGLASTETIGVNLVNGDAITTNGNAASCTGSVAFMNAAGTTIGTATPFTLAAKVATSINLPFSSSGLTGIRGLIRTVVTTTTTSGIPCSLSYSLNTFDTSTGATHIFLVATPPAPIQTFANFGR
jgi:hypothetical protein